MTLRPLALLGLIVAAGCASEATSRTDDALWLAEQGIGQVEVLVSARSVQRTIEDARTDPQVKHRLLLVQAAKQFAKNTLGLNVSGQYKRVVFLDSPAVVFVTSAARKTELAAYRWEYPVLGELPYRGFFELEDAEREADRMEALGYDASVRPVRTYSLLGFVPDPIVSPMLFGVSETWLVETVIHELAHATVFASDGGAFNEGLATFIGKEGRRQFIAEHYGKDSAIYARMLDVDKDRDTYAQAVAALAFDLRVLFARQGDMSQDEVLREKDAIFRSHQSHYDTEVKSTLVTYSYRQVRLPDNNAELAAYGLYTMQQAVYEQAFERCQRSMACFIRELKAAASEEQPEVALEKSNHQAGVSEILLRD